MAVDAIECVLDVEVIAIAVVDGAIEAAIVDAVIDRDNAGTSIE